MSEIRNKDNAPQLSDIGVYPLKHLTELFSFSPRYLRDAINRHDLTASKIGRSFYVVKDDFLAWVISHRITPDKIPKKPKEGRTAG